MEGIRFISTSKVCANGDDHDQKEESAVRIDLSPWDLQLLPIGRIQKGILLHKPRPDQDRFQFTNDLIDHLKASLSRALDFFPPLAGRLATDEHDDSRISVFITCNNAGAEFIHAVADGVSITDIVQPMYVPEIVSSFFSLNGILNHEGTSKPLLAVQVTELDDGIFIGCTINHAVADGSSFWNFMNSWSEISRGSEFLSKPPDFKRPFLPIRIPHLSISKLSNPGLIPNPAVVYQERCFHFTKENIAKLKAKANGEMGTKKISSFQALVSHIWRSTVRNNKSLSRNPEQEVTCKLLIGARQRLSSPRLSPEYFGNAIQLGEAMLKVKVLLDEQGLGYVAEGINRMVAEHTEEKFTNFLESWRENPQIPGIDSYFNSTNLTTSSSPRFNVYGNDFGWGKPIAVRSGRANKIQGKITFFSGAEEGTIDIEVCLPSETLEGMGNDSEFMEFVTTTHWT